MSGLLAAIEQQARANPDAPAIRSAEAGLSYAQLMTAVAQTAARLQASRAGSLGIYLDNGIDWVVADLAAMFAAIRVVPLPWFFSDAQIEHALADGAVDFIVHAGELPSGIVGTGTPVKLGRSSWLQSLAASARVNDVGVQLPGKLSYTSGTTGKPKGIQLGYEFIDQTCCSIAANSSWRTRSLWRIPPSACASSGAGSRPLEMMV